MGERDRMLTMREAMAEVQRSKRTLLRWQSEGLIGFHDRGYGQDRATPMLNLRHVDKQKREARSAGIRHAD